jgi:MFS family permease
MSDSIRRSGLESKALSKVKYYMLAYVFIGQTFYQLCRNNIGFAQLTMGKDLGLTASGFGLASGIFALSAFLMQIPLGLLYEKLGVRRLLTFNMALWGLVVTSQAFVASGHQLTVLRFFLGIFEAGFLPGAYLLISMWFRGKDHGVATSFMIMGVGAAAIVGGPFAGWILGTHFFGLPGWRNLFLVEGAVTVIWSFLALRILYDDPARARWLKPDERAFMTKYLSEYQAEKTRHGALVTSGMGQVLKDYRVAILVISYFCFGWTVLTIGFFTPTLLKTAGKAVSNQYVGYLAMVPYIAGAIASYFWGRHADRQQERHWHCVLPILIAAAGILLYPIARTPLLAMLLLSVMQAGSSAYNVTFWPTCNMVVGRPAMAKATALIQTGNMIASFLGPVYFGWTIDLTGNTKLGMFSAVLILLANFAIMNVFFFRHKSRQRETQADAPVFSEAD